MEGPFDPDLSVRGHILFMLTDNKDLGLTVRLTPRPVGPPTPLGRRVMWSLSLTTTGESWYSWKCLFKSNKNYP